MKRFLSILLLLCLLLGCGKTEPTPSAPPTQPPAAESPAPQPIPEPAPEEVQPEAPPPAEPKNLADTGEPFADSHVLLHIPNETVEAGPLQDLYLYQNMLLASGMRFMGERIDLQLVLLDLQTGETVREAVLADIGSAHIQICGDRIAVCDEGTGRLRLLDENLQEYADHQVAEPWETICVSTDCAVAYRITMDEGIHAMDLATGETTILLPEARSLFADRPNGGVVSFRYVDSVTQLSRDAALDLTTGAISEPPFAGSFYGVSRAGELWLAGLSANTNHYLGSSDDPAVFDAENRTAELLGDPVRLMLTDHLDDGSLQVALYEPDGTLLSAYSLPDAWHLYITRPVWSEQNGGYFMTVTDPYGSTKLLFWDLRIPAEGENLPLAPLSAHIGEIPEGAAVSQSLYDRAAALSETYGVTIRIADQCATEYMTYTALQNTDHWQLTTTLDALETALSAYPEGFFSQLRYGVYLETEINLVGQLTPRDLPDGDISGFDTFTAFVEHADGKHIVVLDAGHSTPEQTFYHEVSHIIEDKLFFDSLYRDDALFDEEEWADLNPENFGYTFTYYNIPDAFYTDGYEAYFVDIYSRTYPSEDRARILEYAMLGWDWMFTQNEPLQAKLAYYAACIRDAFDTTGWPETTAWEQPLNT